jgi:rod shape-determining protein MreD
MIHTYVNRLCWFVGLLLVQVILMNHIHLFGYATPYIYIYLILSLESNTNRNELMLWAFFLGLFVDMFSDTPGMHASACVLLAFVRPSILKLYIPRDMFEIIQPSFKTIGIFSFIKYTLFCILIHHTFLLCIEYFSFTHWGDLLLRIVSCTLLSTAFIMAIEGVRRS